MIDLIVCDIEGCLSPAKGMPLALADLHSLQQTLLAPNTPSFVLCTGRPQPFTEAYSQMLGLKKASVAENGAYLFDPIKDEIIYNPVISQQQLSDIAHIKHNLQDLLQGVEYKVEPGKEVCISLNPIAALSEYPEKVGQLYERVKKELSGQHLFITHSASAVDITPQGVNKGSGVRFLAEYLDVSLEEMLGIGDTQGDMPFLEIVGQSATPSNAADALKNHVNYVSEFPDASGVVDILNHYTSQLD